MKTSILKHMICRNCSHHQLEIRSYRANDVEIREGDLFCPNCRVLFPIKDGILFFEEDRIDHKHLVWAEKRLEKKVGLNNDWILSLPHPTIDFETSFESKGGDKAMNFEQIFEKLKLSGKERILELGAGTCWVMNRFASVDCEGVACDIELRKYYGLRSAEVYLYDEKSNRNYFERFQMGFGKLPFTNESFDIVFIQSALQFAEDLGESIREICRVLRFGGRLVLVYQGVTGILKRKKYYGNSVSISKYLQFFKKNGMETGLFFPASVVHNLEKRISEPRKFRVVGKVISYLWCAVPFLKWSALSYGVFPMTILFGVPVSVIAVKSANVSIKR